MTGIVRVVGSFARHAVFGVSVRVPPCARNRIVIYHAIQIAGGDKKAKFRFAERLKSRGAMPVRLCYEPYLISLALEQSIDDSRAKTRMIDIGIPRNQNKIQLLNVSRAQLFG